MTSPLVSQVRPLKVLQVVPALDGGGVERGTLEVAKSLVAAGHDSQVLSAGGRMVKELETDGSRHITWNLGKKSPTTLLQVRKLRRWLAKEQFDILHVRSRMPAWIVWLAWRKLPPHIKARCHLVSTVHGLHSVNRYSAIMTCGERVIAVSRTCREYILSNYPDTPPEKIELIYRGVDAQAFPYGYRPEPAWLADWYRQNERLESAFIVTLPGRLTRLKGHAGFLRVVARLKQQGVPVLGLIVGGEDPKRKDYAAEIHNTVKEMGLTQDIFFTGHRRDMKDIYAASHAVLSLSTKPESFGRTVLEALAIGTPVIGYAQGGVSEILAELYPQGACQPNDEEAVFSGLMRLYEGALPLVKTNTVFLLEDMCKRTLALYQRLCHTAVL